MLKIRKIRFSILMVIALFAMVSVASAALPPNVVGTISNPGPSSYWNIVLTSGGNPELPSDPTTYIGWCADSNTGISPGSGKNFEVFSSLGLNPVTSIPSANWNKINWIINNKHLVSDWEAIQAAIWHYDGQSGIAFPGHSTMPNTEYDHAEYNALIAAADTHGDYIPTCGENYAVIIWSGSNAQALFIENKLLCDNPPPPVPAPEFPSVALPVGMIIGIVGLVYAIKEREN
ncbi:MAG: thioester domain-containing protein [Methanoregula sp.]|nr:thioester domain-containing protein [Methanoregula sp.]